MNRSILIVVVDFLLLSLLFFAKFDDPEAAKKQEVNQAVSDTSTSTSQDMVDVLKLSLDEERLAREKLNTELNQTQVSLTQTASALTKTEAALTQTKDTLRVKEETLADREKRIHETQDSLARKEEEARRLDAERAQLSTRLTVTQTNLAAVQQQYNTTRSALASTQQQLESTRNTASNLEKQLATTSTEARQNKDQLDALQAELRRREQETARLAGQMQELEKTRSDLEKGRLAAETEKQRIAGQLQAAETEKRLTREQLETMKGEVQTVRAEKEQLQQQAAKLADNVGSLADKSEKLTQEIRENRTLASNTIFQDFNSNRLDTVFQAGRSGLFGVGVNKQELAKTVLVSLGSQIYAIYHIEDTPLSFTPIGTEWERLTGTLGRGPTVFSIGQVSFLDRDPRIIIVPVGEQAAQKLGTKVYPVASNPFRFQDAVLVGARESYYGECKFQIDNDTPSYVRMQRERFSIFSGRFTPSRGDLVFSKTGELLGVMANKEYCLMLGELSATRSIRLGTNISDQQPAQFLSQMYNRVISLPYKLQ
jgi:septal ring factor EnvC (AmiA/AmiB activator)